jgi:anti-sigma factor RsiW
MMKLSREIVLDLLPLYLSGEARKETVAAVEEFLREDPELAEKVAGMELPSLGQVPRPISKEVEMEAYKRANWANTVRTIALAVVLSGTVLAVLLIVPLIFMRLR